MSLASLLAGRLRGGSAFLLGTPAEIVELFGTPPPRLPDGIVDAAGVERLAVEISPRLREAFSRWLAAAARGIAAGGHGQPAGAGASLAEVEAAYLEALAQCLREVRLADRRQGLANLFWLAHSREIAEELGRLCAGRDTPAHLRYGLHPLIAGLLRRGEERSREVPGRSQRLVHDFRLGHGANEALVAAIIEDQLPLTEADPGSFAPERALIPQNPRFRIEAPAFDEVRNVLRAAIARSYAAGDRALCRSLEAAGAVPPGAAEAPAAWDRFLFADNVRETLLRDYDGALAALRRSAALRAEITGRGLAELLADFAEVGRCLRRAEMIVMLRRALAMESRGLDRPEARELFQEGGLFRFGFPSAVQSTVRTATILFADIRGFTSASEGQVSEGELAQELYEIFDPAALIVRRFGGRVDAYLGDGFMATFSGSAPPAESALAAVRSAVALQQVLGRLRRQGRTAFRMGISLHSGRVSVARFFRDEREVQTTCIGRQVNIAGRLSSSAGDPASVAGSPGARCVGDVAVDGAGNLVNHGIAVSGALLAAIGPLVCSEPFREGGVEGSRWYDPELCLWMHFGYAGEARFRGLGATMPVYGLVAAAPATAHTGQGGSP